MRRIETNDCSMTIEDRGWMGVLGWDQGHEVDERSRRAGRHERRELGEEVEDVEEEVPVLLPQAGSLDRA